MKEIMHSSDSTGENRYDAIQSLAAAVTQWKQTSSDIACQNTNTNDHQS